LQRVTDEGQDTGYGKCDGAFFIHEQLPFPTAIL